MRRPLVVEAPLYVSEVDADGDVELHLAGELDMLAVPMLAEALAAAIDKRVPRVVVDAARLSYIDSSGIDCLMNAAFAAKLVDTRLVVRNAEGIVRRVLAITGVDDELLEAPGDQPVDR